MKSTLDERPFISIIVPVYNGADTIADCIAALLSLQYPEDKREIIVVDNNSSDTTAEIIRQFPVIYLKEVGRQSSYAARNLGIQHAKGEIFAFTDSDCIPDPQWVEEGAAGFTDELVGAVAGKILAAKPVTLVEEFLQASHYLSEEVCLQHPFLPYIQTANAFYRRAVFDEIGAFNQNMVSGGDADITWRMQLQTSYKVRQNEKALVVHKHRATMDKFYRQMFVHGRGKADLERIYSEEMGKKGIRLESRSSIVGIILRILVSLAYHGFKSLVWLLCLRGRPAVFELISWYGKTGKRLGVRRRIKQQYGSENS